MRSHSLQNGRASGISLVAILVALVVAPSLPVLAPAHADDRPPATGTKGTIDPSQIVPTMRIPPDRGEVPAELPPDETGPSFVQQPAPSLVLDVPGEVLIGQDFDFTVTFQHAPLLTGFGPYVELWLPFSGVDGNDKFPSGTGIIQKCDGINFGDVNNVSDANELFTSPSMVPINNTCPPSSATPSVYALQNGTPCSSNAADNCLNTTCTASPSCFYGTADPTSVSLAGYQKVVLPLTFGSFVITQPDVHIKIKAHVSDFADAGAPLTIYARGGFQHGGTATGTVPTFNPTIYSATTRPTIFIVKKEYLGPENETATGPNNPQKYLITVDIADALTVTNVGVVDCLDDNMLAPPPSLPLLTGNTTPGYTLNNAPVCGNNCLDVGYPVAGAPNGPDPVKVEFNFFVPERDCNNLEILGTHCRAQSVDDVRARADWDPNDPRDFGIGIVSDISPNDHTLIDKCFALQKGWTMFTDTGHPDPTPGDTIEYTLQFQVSDYRTLGDIILTDYLSDGQTYVPSSGILTVTDKYKPLPTSILFTDGLNLFVNQNIQGDWSCNDGTTLVNPSSISFDVSQLIPGPRPTLLTGGLAGAPSSQIPATGFITFRATIDDKFTRRPIPPSMCVGGSNAGNPCTVNTNCPDGFCLVHDVFVDKDDKLFDCPVIEATVFTNEQAGVPPAPTPTATQDDSFATLQIVSDTLVKSVCNIWTGSTPPAFCNTYLTPPTVSPGDHITFRIGYQIPSSDAEGLVLHDWVPLPVLDASNMGSGPVTFGSGIPPTNSFRDAGPLALFTPSSVSPPLGNNDFTINYQPTSSFNDPANVTRNMDFRFTLDVNTQPFADGLHFTNEVTEQESDTFGNTYGQVSVAEFVLGEPKLRIKKGVVSTDNPAAVYDPAPPWSTDSLFFGFNAPPTLPPFIGAGKLTSTTLAAQPNSFRSDVINVDAFDTIRFAVIVENLGTSPNGAFDVIIHDSFGPPCWSGTCTGDPSQLCDTNADCVGLGTCVLQSITSMVTNLEVRNGAGTPLPCVGGCTVSGFFGPGIELQDSATGALTGYSSSNPSTGTNVAVITFDLTMPAGTRPTCQCVNSVELLHYAGVEGGPDHVAANLSTPFPGADGAFHDSAKIRVEPKLTKSIVSTSEPTTSVNNLAIGEIVRYRLEIVVPEGTMPGTIIQDTLPADLSWIGVPNQCSFVVDPFITSTVSPALLVTGANNETLSLTFGDVTNSCVNCGPQRIVIECNAFVLNMPSNVSGGVKSNNFTVKVTNPFPTLCTKTFTSNTVSSTIVEPAGVIDKVQLPLNPNNPGETRYRLTYVNSGTSFAFGVHVTDVSQLPIVSAVATPNYCIITGIGTLQLDVDCGDFQQGGSVTIEYTTSGKQLCQSYTNTATLTYTSLFGPDGWPTPTIENPTGSVTPGASGTFNGERVYSSQKSLVVNHCPDLSVEKSHVGDFPAGGYGTYTIVVSNIGNVTSIPTDVITDPLPPGLIYFSSTAPLNWSCSGTSVVTCTNNGLGIPPLSSILITITVIVPCGQQPVDNCATVTTGFDGNPTNDTDCDHTNFTSAPECVIAVAAGGSHSLALRSDGTVWAWGSNTYGQLGTGGNVDSHVPVQVVDPSDPSGFLTGVTKIAAGFRHSLALKNDGKVRSWGWNAYGQLGRLGNPLVPDIVKHKFGDLTNVVAIACTNHSVAMTAATPSGEAWAWGLNSDGQLCNGTVLDKPYAVPVQDTATNALSGVKAVTTGARDTYVLLTNGTVVSCGDNSLGQRGRTGGAPLLAVDPVVVFGPSTTLTGITAIAGASGSAMGLKNDGTVWTWGSNVHGELGNNTTVNSPGAIQVLGPGGIGVLTGINLIAGGADHQLAVKNTGTVFTWGRADLGQLGNGALFESHVPVQVVDPSGFLSSVTGIAEGSSAHHALVIQNGGSVRSWGSNFKGQLGDDTTTNSSIPVYPVVPCPGCVPPPSHMTAWWPFDEPSGTVARDIRLTPNNGTYVLSGGGPTPTPGMVGYSLRFSGGGDHVTVQPQADLDFGTGDFTIDTWINTQHSSGLTTLLDKRVTATPVAVGYSLFLFNGRVGLQLADGGADNYTEVGPSVATGVWTHIAVTVRRKDPNGITFYVGGQAQGPTYDPTPHPTSLDNTIPLLIGARQPAFGAQYFDGSLDELEFFKRALSGDEIRAIFNAGSAGKCKCVSCDEQWADKTTNTAGARAFHAMTYDNAVGKVVLFGGAQPSTYLSDTWEWDGLLWTQLAFPSGICVGGSTPGINCIVDGDCAGAGVCVHSPGKRAFHAMAYDSANNRVVMFGGYNGTALLNDTWVFDGSTWKPPSTTGGPPSKREGPAMAYDASIGKVVLFGGLEAGAVYKGDTWLYDVAAKTWTPVSVGGSIPGERAFHAMAYDSTRQRVILFGGYSLVNGDFGDTWEWDGTSQTWSQTATTGPSARSSHSMVYVPECEEIVLFGGLSGSTLQGDTWGFDGTNWSLLDTTGPQVRYSSAMAHDLARGASVLFGGNINGSNLGDTWERSP